MSAQLTIGGAVDIDLGGKEAKQLEVAYTPGAIARQILVAVNDLYKFSAPRVLDPSAGTGVFGAEARRLWSESTIVGVEPRDEQLPSAYDETHCSTFEAFASDYCRRPFDLAATNPPFTCAAAFVEIARPLLTPDGLVVLLLPVDWWQRNESLHARMMETHEVDGLVVAPHLWTHVYTIGGGVCFRGPKYSSDFRNYAAFVWDARPRMFEPGLPLTWLTSPLPWLPGAERKWITPPGRE